MRKSGLFYLWLVLSVGTWVAPAWSATEPLAEPSIVFLNPGEPVDRGKGLFWPMTGRLMSIAAEAFGMQLEVLYAERDHLRMLRQAESLLQRESLPDYLVMVNEKRAAEQMLQLFAGTETKILLIHNDLTELQRSRIGNEREQISNWIGTATTDEESGTYRMMAELYRQLGSTEPQVVGITGDRSTPVSMKRAQGVTDYMTDAGRGRSLQLVFSNWSTADAYSKTEVLLKRYPQANVIWAANYSMALGALRAVQASHAAVVVGSSAAAPPDVKDSGQGMAVSLGSHFFIGAWAMVLLHDYHHGVDFADYGGARQVLDHLYVINADNAPGYYQAVYEQTDELNFRVFSKYLHPETGGYAFSLEPLLPAK
ncbi:ABC transporter substrate-binding protein [Reinekea marinisedimentorum]|uniref:ABC-type sugar transport system substrate-binding protein n=1 Tax=Reinekea marinisedimentorum TaxID=230495 RepID=A0A4R3I6J8_9GAMM|nr:ABC transporter substrate-binding protein [Reinekea marinisedimentorum]TCS40443.1 ABC-type sugar transport system substrate-binding protein [Reinekea marinisedimentorum]